MSSGLCKNPEGAVAPFKVETVKDGVDDAVDAGHVHETDHGARTPPDLYKNTLDDIGGAKLAPQVARKTEETEQFRQIFLQLLHHRRIMLGPALAKTSEHVAGVACRARPVDGLS